MLDSSEDVISRQRLDVVAGMVVAEPIQKAAAAQKNTFAGLGLQAPHPADSPKRKSEASIRVSIYTGNGSNEPLRRHSHCISQRRHCSIRGESVVNVHK